MKKIQIALILFLLFSIDIASKNFIINKLPEDGVYLFNKIGLEFHKNYGIAFGINIYNILTITLSSIIIILLLIAFQKSLKLKKYNLNFFIGLIIIGAISNLMDRILYGYVIDFITIYFLPVFNLSDLYIMTGIIFCFTFLNKKSPDKMTGDL